MATLLCTAPKAPLHSCTCPPSQYSRSCPGAPVQCHCSANTLPHGNTILLQQDVQQCMQQCMISPACSPCCASKVTLVRCKCAVLESDKYMFAVATQLNDHCYHTRQTHAQQPAGVEYERTQGTLCETSYIKAVGETSPQVQPKQRCRRNTA